MKKSFSVLFIIFPYITLLYQYIMSFVFEQYTQGNRAIEWTIPLVYLILGLLFGWCIFMKNRLGKREQLFLEIIHLIILQFLPLDGSSLLCELDKIQSLVFIYMIPPGSSDFFISVFLLSILSCSYQETN